MNYIKHLTGFFDKVVKDRTLNPTHVSLYIALFQFWNCNRFINPISISRDEVMRISKISSKATYHKCLKNLHALGYINYEPSYNPFKGSQVFLLNLSDELKPIPKQQKNTRPNNKPLFKPVQEQVADKSYTSPETSNEQALVPYINNTNIPNISNNLNIANLGEQAKKNKIEEDNVIARNEAILQNETNPKEEKSSAKKENEEMLETLDDANRQMLQTFANSNENQIEKSWQKSSAKKEEKFFTFAGTDENKIERQKEMPEKLLIENPKRSSLAFADYNAQHTEISRQKSAAKKEKEEIREFVTSSVASRAQSSDEKPIIENIKTYFQQNNFPELEAQKFFNYFSSIGWLVGGKTPMVNWQSAAQNWILNAPKFTTNETQTQTQTNRAKNLNTTTNKDYSEPL